MTQVVKEESASKDIAIYINPLAHD